MNFLLFQDLIQDTHYIKLSCLISFFWIIVFQVFLVFYDLDTQVFGRICLNLCLSEVLLMIGLG